MSALRFSRTLLVHAMIWSAGVVVPAVLAAQTQAGADWAPTPYQTGLAAWLRGDITAARNAFERVVRLNPRSADAAEHAWPGPVSQGGVSICGRVRSITWPAREK